MPAIKPTPWSSRSTAKAAAQVTMRPQTRKRSQAGGLWRRTVVTATMVSQPTMVEAITPAAASTVR
jgi:hypothetical protein